MTADFQPGSRAAPLSARLAAFEFTSELTERGRERMLATAQPKHFVNDTVIVRAGQPCSAVPLVERGAVRVSRLADRELLLYDVLPGEACVLALSSAIRDTPYPARATVLANTDAILVDAVTMRALFAEDPAVQQYVMTIFANRFGDLMELAHQVAFQRLESRLARLLIREAALANGDIAMTHAELAALLGSAREVVSRTLDRFQKSGWVELGRKRIRVLQPDALREV